MKLTLADWVIGAALFALGSIVCDRMTGAGLVPGAVIFTALLGSLWIIHELFRA